MKLNKGFLVFIIGLFLFSSGTLFGQNSHEIQLIRAIASEKKPKKKFSRLMVLAEYYKENNIVKADSISHVLLKESRNHEDSIRFKALFYYAEIAQIRGSK